MIYVLISSGNLKYSEEIEINTNIEKVVSLFNNPYNMAECIDHFESYEIISGNIREIGSQAKITSKWENDKMVMIEEVITRDPYETIITYTSGGVFNIVTNRFIKISENKTLFINEHEFRFQDENMRKMRISQPIEFDSMFKNQSKLYLVNFKKFVENQE